MSKLKKRVIEYYHFFCPGCKHEHTYAVCNDNSQWQFNGNIESPSFTPSLLNRMEIKNEQTGKLEEKERCHLFVTNGKIIYCGDCSHELSGQTVELPNVFQVDDNGLCKNRFETNVN